MRLNTSVRVRRRGFGLICPAMRKWYSLRVVRSVERVFGFAKRPNTMFNPARFGRWTPNRFALGCQLT